MGIDTHSFNFLRYCNSYGGFGKTVTIGRQSLMVDEPFIRAELGLPGDYRKTDYCEPLLARAFGASQVDSIDNSDYEQASIVHDMNLTIPEEYRGRYDTVLDSGTLEHIYNIPQAFENASLLCKAGGQLIHIVPANNFCGHGFWQLSPELFFSLYAEKNGYTGTEVFIADLSRPKEWRKVPPPDNGRRVDVFSSTRLYSLVRTVRKREAFSHQSVQQSDYLFQWNKEKEEPLLTESMAKSGRIRRVLKQSSLYRLILPAYHNLIGFRARIRDRFFGSNRGLLPLKVNSLINRKLPS